MSLKLTGTMLFLTVLACLAFSYPKASVQAQGPIFAAPDSGSQSLAAIVYSQPPTVTGILLQSSRWVTNTDDDQYVWNDFTLPVTQMMTDVNWRGGYDPSHDGFGGPVADFTVAIYPSIVGGSSQTLSIRPSSNTRWEETLARRLLGHSPAQRCTTTNSACPPHSRPRAGTKYWVQIEAFQQNVPDWGIAAGTGGDGKYFRRIANVGDIYYQIGSGDAAFTLLGPLTFVQTIYLPLIIN